MKTNTTWAVVKPSTVRIGETSLVMWCYSKENAEETAKELNTKHNTTKYTIEEVEKFETN